MKKYGVIVLGVAMFIAPRIEAKFIKKVVIPAAGIGSRFLPLTKAIPKEMIPLTEKPAMHFIAEEAQGSGLTDLVVISSDFKQALKNYFDPFKSEFLKPLGKYHMVEAHEQALANLSFTYVEQDAPKGLGHAVLLSEPEIGNNYFGVILPDDIYLADDPAIGQLMRIAEREQASVIAVQEVPMHMVQNYGVISFSKQIDPLTFEINDLVEKPAREKAPSNLAIVGRYVLSPKVYESLKYLQAHNMLTKNELQLTDAIAHMLKNSGERVIAYIVQGERHDTGNPLGWMKAVIANGMRDPRYHDQLVEFMEQRLYKDAQISTFHATKYHEQTARLD
ncbi:MAG: UTP--glucose-1-phosphate uridylyltransferase [Candidatus Babeliales bacterium]